MASMFASSKFTGDISKWKVYKVSSIYGMFDYSDFNSDISSWDISGVKDIECIDDMFD